MIVGLALLAQIYFFYMLSLVAQGPKSFIMIVSMAILYIIYFSVISKKPVHSLYGFLLITLFFPKAGNNFGFFVIEELRGVTMFAIMQNIAAIPICLNLLRIKKFKKWMPRNLSKFCLLFFSLILLTLFMGLLRQIVGDYLVDVNIGPEELVWNAPMLSGLIFLCGCIAFFKRMEQVEKIFLIIISAGIITVIESILYVYLRLPLPFANYVFNDTGRYNSIFFSDFVTLPLICNGAAGFILYFAFTRKRKALLLLIPFLFLPILATFQRTPMVSTFIIVGIFLMLQKNIQLKYGFSLMALFLTSASILLKTTGGFIGEMTLFFDQVRPDYFFSYMDSWASRAGAYLRGLEAFIFSLPAGVGTWRMEVVMSSFNLPRFLRDFVQSGPMEDFYSEIADGRATAPHNFYINFIGEYGLLGVFLMILFVYLCFKKFQLTGKNGKRKRETQPKLFMAQTAAYSILIGISFWFIFYHYIFYWLLFFLLFIMFFVPEDGNSPMNPDCLKDGCLP